jgi:branched-chain amino acid transport system ATP-binding protein
MTAIPDGAPVLELRGVTKRYGAFKAVDDVSISLPRGERHGLIGPNGAGKTTLFNLIAGTLRVSSGRVLLKGDDMTSAGEHVRARAGVGRTFQHSSLFATMTCAENLALAVRRSSGWGTAWYLAAGRRRAVAEETDRLLAVVSLTERGHDLVADLSHGERRQLEVAMALAGSPELLLFDEPTAGMSPIETAQFTELVLELPGDLTVLVIEHDLDVVFSVADRLSVLAAGRLLEQGTPDQIRSSPQVEDVYLGTGHEEVFITS